VPPFTMPERFNLTIRDKMHERAMSITDLAARSGVTPAKISNYINAKSDLYTANLERLCIALDLELVDRQPSKGRKKSTGPDAKAIAGPRVPRKKT
jgi:DNA-binding Xre family transcriptional regulator